MAKDRRIVSKILIFSLIAVLFSCSNPLNVTTMVRENDIRGAKSTDLLSFVISGGDYGLTEPDGEVTYKIGTVQEISFAENSLYQFEKWEVVNSTTGKPVNDVLKLENESETETSVTILRAADNILLRPVCNVRPKVESTIPAMLFEGVYRDSVIIVKFDSAISEDSFYYTAEELTQLEADSILKDKNDKAYGYVVNDNVHFKNIKITSKDDANLLAYFEPPVIENGTILKVRPKQEKALLQPNDNNLDIDVFISPDVFDLNGVSIGGEGVQWRYRINPNTDTTPPVFSKLSLAKTKGLLKSSIESDFLVPGTSFNPSNHIKNAIYFACTGTDEGSGISYIKVESQRLQDAMGNPVQELPVTEILSNGTFIKDDKGIESTDGSFILTNKDGLIQVSFTLYDMSGNSSKDVIKYLIAKDTFIDLSSCHLYNTCNYTLESKYTAEQLSSVSNTICWKDIPDDIWQKDSKTSAQDLKYTLFWGYDDKTFENKVECKKDNCFADGIWSVTVSEIDTSKTLYLKLSVTDSVGNEKSIKGLVPASPSYFTYQKVASGGEYSYIDQTTGKTKTIPYPAHYRIFRAEGDEAGYLYYQYDDEILTTQSFLNITVNKEKETVEYSSKKYFDIYVDDISKCKFYYQSSYCSEEKIENPEAKEELKKVLSKIEQKVSSGAFLKDLENYNPDLRNTYLVLAAKENTEEAQQIVNGFYFWNYISKYQMENYYNTVLVSPLADFTISESATLLPPVLNSIKITKGNINSGVNKASIKYSSTAPYGTIYGFFWGKSENEITNYETEEEFNIESGISTLYFKTTTIDTKTGQSVISDVSVYDLSDYAFDTAAPKISNFDETDVSQNPNDFFASEYYPVVTFEICYDDYELVNGKAEYTLYVVPAESSEQTFGQLSEDVIKTSPFIVGTFNPPTTKYEKVLVWNNIEGLGSSDYYFYVIYLKDISGNYSYTPLKLSKQLLEKVPVVSFTSNAGDSSLVDVKIDIEKEIGYRNYEFVYNVFDTDEKDITYYPCQSMTASKDKFFFAYAKAVYQVGQVNLTKYSYPVYFFSSKEKCELKDVIDGLNGAQIYCDRPCLVMTYWSSENYGYEIQDWEAFGVQTNLMYISAKNPVTQKYEETLKYYTINYDEIPMGKYFVVIAHFADGTSLMSRKINTN